MFLFSHWIATLGSGWLMPFFCVVYLMSFFIDCDKNRSVFCFFIKKNILEEKWFRTVPVKLVIYNPLASHV